MVLSEGLPRNALSPLLFSHPHRNIAATRFSTPQGGDLRRSQITGQCIRAFGADFLRAIAYLTV